MTNNKKPLSNLANKIWEAFNLEEAGVFIDYGDKLAAALRVLAPNMISDHDGELIFDIANELDGQSATKSKMEPNQMNEQEPLEEASDLDWNTVRLVSVSTRPNGNRHTIESIASCLVDTHNQLAYVKDVLFRCTNELLERVDAAEDALRKLKEAGSDEENPIYELEDGFYWVSSPHEPMKSLARLYTNPDTGERGLGFGIWDGAGFVPLSDLHEKTELVMIPDNHGVKYQND
jgi:hypothetical protein